MEISHQLAPLVLYDDYDTRGFVLDIKQNILVELNERDTCMLSAILGNSTLTEVLQQIDGCVQSQLLDKVGEPDVLALLERLEEQKILEPQKNGVTSDPLCTDKHQHEEVQLAHFYAVTRRQRLIGGGSVS